MEGRREGTEGRKTEGTELKKGTELKEGRNVRISINKGRQVKRKDINKGRKEGRNTSDSGPPIKRSSSVKSTW
jgi:hypothetical protein